MIATQEDKSPQAESLCRRLIALTRLVDTVEPKDARSLLDRVLQRMQLFARMTVRVGVGQPKSALTFALLREAELDCMECREWQRCRRWLDGRAPGDEPNAFCPNHGLFAALPQAAIGAPPTQTAT